PTYLVYFLGMENLRPGAERASVLRALKVSLAVSAGFMSIFVVIGAITKLSTNWLVEKAQWVALVIGLALLVLGIAMLFGYRLPVTTPQLDVGQRDRSVHSMYVFGLAYAIASIGCTIGPFSSVVLGSFSTDGLTKGIAAIALYGVGMALVVTGLTVTLAMANTALLRILRRGMAWFEQLAGILLILTGMYLCWYWYSSITDGTGGRVVAKATGWNHTLATFVEDHQTAVVWGGVIVILAAVVTAFTVQRKEPAS
ncbi:MAG TPA: cytochrome c biogenesis protein CcdA, partial [Ilumatobacteraceae bacterium]|nr:cytochrome c biogenesis protein CcdA [Ilumatobacteraceae bacterium]